MALTAAAPVPHTLIAYLDQHSRQETVHQHAVTVNVSWWNHRTEPLRGGPVVASGQTAGRHPITRADLFQLGEEAVHDDSGTGAVRLLWHALAWGTGTKHRNNKRRIRSVLDDDEAPTVLYEAARASRTDPSAAFSILRQRRKNYFTWLGPNFFTKFLYFAGGGDPAHPSLIVDQFVRASLYRETGIDPRFRYISQYPVSRYVETLDQLAAWAGAAQAEVGRPVAPDEVERWAFSVR